MEVNMEPIES